MKQYKKIEFALAIILFCRDYKRFADYRHFQNYENYKKLQKYKIHDALFAMDCRQSNTISAF